MMREEMKKSDKIVISDSLADCGDIIIPCFTLEIRIVTDTEFRISLLKPREWEKFGSRIEKYEDIYN